MLHPELAKIEEVRARFLREGYVANRVPHSGVVRIIDDDDDEDDATVFLVMELLEGSTLSDRAVSAGGRLPADEVVGRALECLDVLAAAHEHGIVHRDLKPENLFVTSRGELKVLDFGVARLVGAGATRSGQLLGTPAFMAPEQAGGRIREIDARTDLWSLGAVMFTLLTGRPVHLAANPAEQMIYAATQPAPAIGAIAPVPAALSNVIDRALAFGREARWASARAMQEALLDAKYR
jgi:serine/threonine protein kinase